jgi:DNA-binding NarL/FixJ family response regulator
MVILNTQAISKQKIRVFLVDDHDLALRGLQKIICAEPDMAVVGIATEASGLNEKILAARVNVVLLDVRMTNFDVLQLVNALQKAPESHSGNRVAAIIFVTAFVDPYIASQAQKLGVSGYLLKEEALSLKLPGAIRAVINGSCVYSEAVQKLLYDPRASEAAGISFGGEEYHVLALMVSGHTPAQIAQKLDKSLDSIYSLQYRLRNKLDVKKNGQAVRKAIAENIVPLNLR